MDAEEAGVADRDERVVDLEVEDRADPAVGHLGERAAPVERAGSSPAVPVGRERNPVPLGEQDPAGQPVDGRHLALDEEAQVLDAERVVLVEERRRRGVVLRAGHHVQRHRRPWRRPSATTFSAWIWNSDRSVTGPIG